MTATHELRVWASSLTDYNNGILHGLWIEVTDPKTMHEQIQAMLEASPTAKQSGLPAKEWAFHDFEGFTPYRPNEYEAVEDLCKIAEQVEEHGEVYLHWLTHDGDVDNDFTDEFIGEYDSLAEYAAEQWEEWSNEQEPKGNDWWHPSKYVNWQDMGEDMETNGDIFTIDLGGKVLIFSNR